MGRARTYWWSCRVCVRHRRQAPCTRKHTRGRTVHRQQQLLCCIARPTTHSHTHTHTHTHTRTDTHTHTRTETHTHTHTRTDTRTHARTRTLTLLLWHWYTVVRGTTWCTCGGGRWRRITPPPGRPPLPPPPPPPPLLRYLGGMWNAPARRHALSRAVQCGRTHAWAPGTGAHTHTHARTHMRATTNHPRARPHARRHARASATPARPQHARHAPASSSCSCTVWSMPPDTTRRLLEQGRNATPNRLAVCRVCRASGTRPVSGKCHSSTCEGVCRR
jgi:hypothetical protein